MHVFAGFRLVNRAIIRDRSLRGFDGFGGTGGARRGSSDDKDCRQYCFSVPMRKSDTTINVHSCLHVRTFYMFCEVGSDPVTCSASRSETYS